MLNPQIKDHLSDDILQEFVDTTKKMSNICGRLTRGGDRLLMRHCFLELSRHPGIKDLLVQMVAGWKQDPIVEHTELCIKDNEALIELVKRRQGNNAIDDSQRYSFPFESGIKLPRDTYDSDDEDCLIPAACNQTIPQIANTTLVVRNKYDYFAPNVSIGFTNNGATVFNTRFYFEGSIFRLRDKTNHDIPKKFYEKAGLYQNKDDLDLSPYRPEMLYARNFIIKQQHHYIPKAMVKTLNKLEPILHCQFLSTPMKLQGVIGGEQRPLTLNISVYEDAGGVEWWTIDSWREGNLYTETDLDIGMEWEEFLDEYIVYQDITYGNFKIYIPYCYDEHRYYISLELPSYVMWRKVEERLGVAPI